ncbi:MAG: hypothetical protein Q4Q07_00160 [Tissierellia bacterium]|nr:hypothetical protein [Tissierellia bacterium]
MNHEYNENLTEEYESESNDKASVLLSILFFVLPVIGLIYYFVKRKEKPRACKTYLVVILVSLGINALFSLLK